MNKIYQKFQQYMAESFSIQGYKRYQANTLWLFLQRIITGLATFVIGIYVARYLGPKDFGLMSYCISFAGIFSVIATFGIDDILKREIIRHSERRNELLSTSFWLKLSSGTLAVVLVSLLSILFYSDLLTRVLIILFSFTFIFQSVNIFDIFFQSQVKAKRSVKIQIYVTIVSIILKIICIVLNKSIIWFVGIYVIESILTAFGLWLTFKIYYSVIDIWVFSKDYALEILKASWPLMLSGVAITTYMRIDQVMIGNMINTTSVGFYAIAVKMSEVWYVIPTVVTASVFPAIINARITNLSRYTDRLKKLYFLMFWLSFIIALPVSVFAKPIVHIILGPTYIQAAVVLRVYIWAGVAVFVGCVLSQYLIAENYTKIYFFTTFIGAIANIFLNFIFIPRFGITGSAVATLISYSLVVFSIIFFKQTKNHARLMLQSIFLR